MSNPERLRSFLLRDKVFLKSLYTSDSIKCKRILNTASDAHLMTLIRLLHFLANGIIPIKRKNFEILQEKKKLHVIKTTLEAKKALKNILIAERSTKLNFLNKLADVYEPLLYALFNEI
jgi:hypothetical protein